MKSSLWNTWYLENKSSRIRTKRGCEANVLKIPFPVTKGHKEMYKKEVKSLGFLGVLEKANDSEWGSPYFANHKPKKK